MHLARTAALAGLFVPTLLTAQAPAPPRASCFPLTAVRLLPGELKTEQDAMLGYLLREELDRLLHNFRVNAGLPSAAKPLGGWEAPDCELRGHYTGHFLSALALMHEATGEPALRDRGTQLVRELGKCQQALGGGYLSAFPRSFLERLSCGERVWAPWYTLHKVGAGLLDQHLRCGNDEALRLAVAFAGFVGDFTRPLDEPAMQRMLQTEFGGMPGFLADLYAVTKDEAHLALARRFTHHRVLDPLAAGRDELKGLHANTQIPKVIAAARLFELTGDPAAGAAARFFWQTVTHHRCYATGGTSSFEYWRDLPDKLSWQLSSQDHENCCTHNLLKLTKLLWQQAPGGGFADYCERALWNGILGTRSPDDPAAIMYYVPMQSGLYRYYGERDNSYVCCSGTGIESFSRLGEFVYAHGEGELWVNLFTPSEVDWAAKGVKLRQETKFPDEAGTVLVVAAKVPVPFTLRVREPFWCRGGLRVAVNGEEVKIAAGGDGYAAIAREWRDGDRVAVTLPMALRCEPLGDDKRKVAVCYGPVVLAADLGAKGMTKEMRKGMGEEAWRRCHEGAGMDLPAIVLDAAKPGLRRGTEPLTFLAAPLGRGPDPVTLRPFHRLRGTRYAVYVHPVEPYPGVIDCFDDGIDQVAGNETTHNFQAWQHERGESHGRTWVRSPLWFRYDLDVDDAGENTLRLTFARDEDATTFELCVDGVVVATPALAPPAGDAPLFDQDFVLPRAATDGHQRVAIMIRVPPPKAVERGATTVPPKPSPRRTPRVFAFATNPLPAPR
ncbi:MAG: glycoside hydrolase family 127 protein [Planctomycetes bacterium]|nr:glycoside hydrolase family 127 protein [Planctomycetota bacterium]